MDDEPVARLDFGGEEREMTRHNSALFTHLGELAMYDHIFVQFDEQGNDQFGAYIFRQNDSFNTLAQFILEHDFPMHLNATEVSDCDRDAFDRSIEKEASDSDFLPDDWN